MSNLEMDTDGVVFRLDPTALSWLNCEFGTSSSTPTQETRRLRTSDDHRFDGLPSSSADWIALAAFQDHAIATAHAELDDQGEHDDHDLAKQLQNPVASLISVPFQFNYDDGIGPKNAGRLTVNIQPVIPIELNEDWNLISRTIVPVIYLDSVADGVDSDFGLGDTVQSFFFSPKDPVNDWIVGFGPVALLPTATDTTFQSEQWGLGPTAVALRQHDGWTYGALANHIWGLNNPSDIDQVNATFLQPFVVYTWPTATSLSLNAEMTYNWTQDDLTLPFNLSVSQLIKIGDQRVQFQIGGRYYADKPSGGPDWGLRFTVTFLFPK